jgi:hypothetical protein
MAKRVSQLDLIIIFVGSPAYFSAKTGLNDLLWNINN